jgi:hypothetical protein
VTPTFQFKSDIDISLQHDLLFIISNYDISFVVLNEKLCSVKMVSYHFQQASDAISFTQTIDTIIKENELGNTSFRKVNIIYFFSQALLVPAEFLTPASASDMLDMVFGQLSENVVLTDFRHTNGLATVYSIPEVIHQKLAETIYPLNSHHLFSHLSNLTSNNELVCIMQSKNFIVAFKKDDITQIVQQFEYSTPEDVAYHLLNICRNYSSKPNDVFLSLFGLIDVKSHLYNELYKYFLHIAFGELPKGFEYPNELTEYPEHYFAHFYKLASCV